MTLAVRLLGQVAVEVDGRPLDLGGLRQRSLIALLILNRNASVGTETLADRLWPDEQPLTATKTIQVYVSRFRKLLGTQADRLASTPAGYLLRIDDSELDASRFERLLADARNRFGQHDDRAAISRFEAALDLWTGGALADLASEPFGRREAERLDEMRLQANEELLQLRLLADGGRAVIPELRRLVREHPTREGLWRQLMLALYAAGRQADALAAYHDARRYLADELGIDPSSQLQELEGLILAQDPRLRVDAASSQSSGMEHGATSLPIVAERATFLSLDPLIGRTDEVAAVEAALVDARLVTITGLGGTGKTRLAQEVLRHVGATGLAVRLVDLAPVSDHIDVPGAIAAVLDVGETAETDLATAIEQKLSHGASVLALDNVEHVLGSAPFIRRLLEQAAPLRILATSRVRIGISGEHEIALAPLAIPTSPDAVEETGAGQLFLRRARAHGRLDALDDAEMAAVVEICRRLDGLPLAIELAAAWTRVLKPRAIARRLREGRLALNGKQDDRQASLERVVVATLGLLQSPDRSAFDTLAAFAGGFDEAAAVAVTGDPDALSMLRRLEEVALVRTIAEADGEARFGLLETIRAVAWERLLSRAEFDTVRRRHAEHYAAEADAATDEWRSSGDGASSAWIDLEEPNIAAAVEEAAALEDGGLAVRLLAVIALHGIRSGRLRDGRVRLEAALERQDVPPAVRSEGLSTLAWLRYLLEGGEGVDTITSEAVAQAEIAGDPRSLARSLLTHATIARPPDAERLFQQAADTALGLGFLAQAEIAYNNLAEAEAFAGRLEDAIKWYEVALHSARQRGDVFEGARYLTNIGAMHAELGRIDEAIECGLRSVAALRSGVALVDDLVESLSHLAISEWLGERHNDAQAHLVEAADLTKSSESIQSFGLVFDAAVIVLGVEHPEQVARALGALDRWIEVSGTTRHGQRRLESAAAVARQSLGVERFEGARRTGHASDPKVIFDEVYAVLLTLP